MTGRKQNFRQKSVQTRHYSGQRRSSGGGSNGGPYQITADDPTLARFLKYSQHHYASFKQHLAAICDADIVEDSARKIVYQCSKHTNQGLELNKRNFERLCGDRINVFLENYKTKKQDFDHGSLMLEVAKDPDYFAQQSRQADFLLFVRWRINQSKVIVSGPIGLVDAKMMEFNRRFYPPSSEKSPRKNSSESSRHQEDGHVFKLPAPDPSVARFIHGSNREQQKFQDFMKNISTASVLKQDDGTIVLECRLLEGCQMSYGEFSVACNKMVLEFLSDYTTKKKCFERSFLLAAFQKYPDFFKEQSKAEDRVLYVRWHRDTNMVILTGLKGEVERTLEAVLRFLNPPVNSIYDPKETKPEFQANTSHSLNRSNNRAMYIRVSRNPAIPAFIKQSRVHMKRMYACFNPLAFVTIVEVDHKMEYHFSPYKGLQVDRAEFCRKVSKLFDEFLADFVTTTFRLDQSAVLKVTQTDVGFFDRQTKENTDYIFLSWRLHKNEVDVTGHKNDVLIKTTELNDIFRPFLASGSNPAYQDNSTKDSVVFDYYPKARYKEVLMMLLNAPNLRSQFEQSCKHLFTINKSSKIPVQVFPATRSVHIKNQCRAYFESYLSKFMVSIVKIDPGVVAMLTGKQKPKWAKDAEENKNIVLKWLNDGVRLFGETNDVLLCRKIMQESLEVATVELAVDKSICRILDKCEVLKKVNAKFNGAVTVTCSSDRLVTVFKGMQAFIELAKNDLAAMDLVEERPTIQDDICDYLNKILSNPSYEIQENTIHALLDNCGIKATLVQRNKKLLVVAATKQAFETCCNRLRNIVHVQSIIIPTGVSMLELLDSSDYKEIESKYHVLCKVKQIDVMTIEANDAADACEALGKLFEKFTGVLLQKDHVDCNENLDKKMEDLSLEKNKNAPTPKKRSKVSLGIAFPGAPGVSGTSCDSSIKSYGKLNVEVKIGNIVNMSCDMIFNGVDNSFNLHKGSVSAAILKAAGHQIGQQCKYNSLISGPFMRVTDGFDLKCNYVLHLVTPSKSSELEEKLVLALLCASSYNVASVAMPTLGAGGIGLKSDEVARLMSRAFKKFSQEEPESVMNVTVVVFNQAIFPLFKKEIIGEGSHTLVDL